MLPIIAIVVVVLIVALLIYSATRPVTFRCQRATSINAPVEKVFALINDFHRWGSWSPWEKLDPELKRNYSGSSTGKGAVYAWEGNRKVGEGRMEITEALAPSKITINLDFLKPFEAHNIAEFTLDSKGGSTSLTWAMHGPNTFMTKVMCIFISMDRMVGKDFEAGLANLKAIAEK